jgi:hypothetical protein
MPGQVDISAGLVPNAPQAQPQATQPAAPQSNIDLSAGLVPNQQQPESRGDRFLDVVNDPKTNSVYRGLMKGTAEDVSGLATIANKLPGVHLPTFSPEQTARLKASSTGEDVGKFGETIGTFAGGEELLKTIGTMAHLGANAPELLELMEKYPKASKLITGILKGSSVGAAQGAIKGAPEGKAVPEAEGGAIGGAVAGPVGEAVAAAPGFVKELMGYGLTQDEASQMISHASKFQPALAVTNEDVLRHAASEGIKLTPSQGTGAPTAKMVQAIGERSILGSKNLADAMDEQAGAFLDSVNRFGDRIDPNMHGGSGLDEAGTTIKNAVDSGKQAKYAAAKAGYAPIDQKFGSANVDTTNIMSKWGNNRADMQVVLDNAPKEIRGKLEEVLNKGASLGTPTKTGTGTVVPSLSFDEAMKLRSFFFEMGDTASAELPKRYQAMYKDLAHDLDGAMEQSAQKQGFANDWRTANAGWKDYVQKYGDNQSPLYQIINQDDPKRATQLLLNRRSVSDIDMLQKENLTPALDAVKRRVVDDITNQHFRLNKMGLGGYSDAFLKKLFGPDDTKELYMKAEIGRRFKWQMNPSGTSNVMMAEHQLTHPTPNALAIPMGAAKASMPREATKYLPHTGKSVVGKVAEGAGEAVTGTGAAEGEKKGSESEGTPVSENDWIHFTDSSGRELMVHPEDWPEVQKRDPGAKPIEGATESAENTGSEESNPSTLQDSGASDETAEPQTAQA